MGVLSDRHASSAPSGRNKIYARHFHGLRCASPVAIHERHASVKCGFSVPFFRFSSTFNVSAHTMSVPSRRVGQSRSATRAPRRSEGMGVRLWRRTPPTPCSWLNATNFGGVGAAPPPAANGPPPSSSRENPYRPELSLSRLVPAPALDWIVLDRSIYPFGLACPNPRQGSANMRHHDLVRCGRPSYIEV